jgi:poly-gamma-glutamate synthesis protein (capsule biosynthesis protein)
VGDIIFGRYTADGFERRPKHLSHAFDGVREALQSDFTLANLETPVVASIPAQRPVPSRLVFGAEPSMLTHLAANGIDAVTVANNHVADQGVAGLTSTAPLTRAQGLHVFGAPSEPLAVNSLDVGDLRVGIVALTTILNFELPDHYPRVPFVPLAEMSTRVLPLVHAARASHDVLIVTVHWGNEFDAMPSAKQRQSAEELIRGGVDLIAGHHPHVLQPIEIIDGGVVAYSLGNFLFDAVLPEARVSGILTLDVQRKECQTTFGFVPTEIASYPLRVLLAHGKVARRARARVQRWTHVKWAPRGDAIHFTLPLRQCNAGR